jgi:glutaminyl-peptide cyclotransferase
LRHVRLITLLLGFAALAGCDKKDVPKDGAAAETTSAESTGGGGSTVTSIKRSPATPAPKVLAEIWKEFSGDKAFAEVRKQVEIGPRPSGSSEIEKARVAIEESLRRSGWDVERQAFTGETPRGPVPMVNLIARFSANGARPAPRDTQRAIVCSHYDTKRFTTISFTGANDGASSTGALLELARVLALDPALASKIELVFFDGEEAIVQFTDVDGLYGSRHYASTLVSTNRASQFKFGILWDMIGDSDLKITMPPDSPQTLARDILAAAEALQLRQHFGYLERAIVDDHVPLNTIARVSTIDLIDFEYPYWHTADDTIDRLSPESLQKIGAVTLYHLRKALAP